ncbi:unnamed protein product [Schistosoma curassoni]|uniref:Transducin/WD40 repeat-like superfamily protein n=1 Tax=Schistosoma curassoni TaxID=6186 RepID=A0A183JMG3_9TREM|nr:unnamed protein product [Schistosoma curassoni]
MCLTHTRDDLLNDIPEASIAVERSHCLNCFSCKQPISQSSNDNIEHSLVYLDGPWNPCAPLFWNRGFPNLLGRHSVPTNPDKALDIHFSFSQFCKQHPCCEKVVSRASLAMVASSVLRWNDFTYKSVSGKTLSSIPSAGVYVSALSYIPQLQGLAVGFSFGGWQLWSLDRLNMECKLNLLNYALSFTMAIFKI